MKDHVDPAYGYIDNKVKLLKQEIRKLKNAHDVAANQLAQTLLELQRIVAGIKVNSDVANFTSIIDSQFPNKSTMRTQVLTEAVAIKSQIQTSKKPIALTAEFYNKWEKTLYDLGADFISY